MMTASVLSAGDGYMYYTNSIATGDVTREPGRSLTDYYTVEGNPPGMWMGGGAAELGLSGTVSEAQMKALFGEGLHPDADAITEQMRAEGASEKDIAQAIKLGRSFYKYDAKDTTLKTRIEKAYLEHERLTGAGPTRDESRRIRMREGAIVFRDVHGRQPVDKEELAKYVTGAMKPGQQAVAGFDFTFSPPKSVTLAWATGGEKTAAIVLAAHEYAIAETIKFIEREGLATRAGTNGVAQMDVQGGVIATRFRHHESRTGDPQLHDHVVISNKVKGIDGKYRTLDSRLALRQVVAGSEHYNARLFDYLDDHGMGARARVVTPGKPVVMELAGISDKLIDLFSTRRSTIKKTTDELVKEYIDDHGRTPDQKALVKISAEAWQRTRPAKDTPRSIKQLRADVRQKIIRQASYHEAETTDQAVRKQSRVMAIVERARPPIDLLAAADDILRNVENARSTWGAHHVQAEITRWLHVNRYRHLTTITHGETHTVTRPDAELFLRRVTLELDSIKVTPDHVHGRFQPLTRASDGESYYVSKGRTLFTSTRVLEAENRLLVASRTTAAGPAPVTAEQFAAALAANPNSDTAQVALAREFVTSRTQLLVGIGPAGAGKTRSMRLAAAAVNEAGNRMFGLAKSKKAAQVFQDDVHVPAFTIDSFLTVHRAAHATGTPVTGKYAVTPGDLIVIDEAPMAGNPELDEVVAFILGGGGYVRPLGDTGQISAVGAGGIIRTIVHETGAVQLEKVYRFTNPDEGAASLILREAPAGVDPFAWYKSNNRIIAGTKETITGVLFTDYLSDIQAGRQAVMTCPTRDYVDELNGRAQAHAIATGTVTGNTSAALVDGHRAYVGDQVMTRLNSRDLTMNQGRDAVSNNDLYTVQAVHRDGSLTVRNAHHQGTITLPATYVKTHTHLGYAFTAHQQQGETIGDGHTIEGVSRGIVTSRTDRALAYVIATRGTTSNILYVEVEAGQHPDEVLAQIAGNVDTNLSAHEMIDVESDRMLDLGRLVDEHAHIVTLANQKRFETLATRVLEDSAAKLIDSDGWDAVAAGLARAEKHGVDVDTLLKSTWNSRDFGDADDIGAVMSYRIEGKLKEMEKAGDLLPLPERGLDTGRYEWAIDRHAATHPDLPENWREHLTERAAFLDQRMSTRAHQIPLEKPEWTTQLGPVPEDPSRQKAWKRLAAEIELFRSTYKVPTTEPTAVPETLRDHDLGRNLAARVTALHKSTAIREAQGTMFLAENTQLVNEATRHVTETEKARPLSDGEKVINALDPERRTALVKQLEAIQESLKNKRTTPKKPADDGPQTSWSPDDAPTIQPRQHGPRH